MEIPDMTVSLAVGTQQCGGIHARGERGEVSSSRIDMPCAVPDRWNDGFNLHPRNPPSSKLKMRTRAMKTRAILASLCAVLLGFGLAFSSTAGSAMDSDSDGVPDDFDNCVTRQNGPLGGVCIAQQDADGDGYGELGQEPLCQPFRTPEHPAEMLSLPRVGH